MSSIKNYHRRIHKFEKSESLGRDETYVCKASHIYSLLNSYTFLKFMNAILRN